MRVIITAIIFLALTASARAELYVLCYHSFLGRTNVPYDFSIDELKAHLEYFKQKGFTFVSYRDLLSGNVAGKKNILVTIDDGNHSVYKAYHEVFKPMGIKPLLSIYPNIIGKKEYAMNWSQLKSLASEGCEIAAHGYFHLKLNKQLFQEKRTDFLQEINKSKKMLEEKLGITVTSFVYPFGLAIEETEKALRDAGYKTGFTIVSKPVRLPLSANANAYKLPRFMFTRPLAKSNIAYIAHHAGVKEGANVQAAEKTGVIPVASNGSTPQVTSPVQKRSNELALTKGTKQSRTGDKKTEKRKEPADTHANKNGIMKKNKPLRKDAPENPSKKAKELEIPDLVKNQQEQYDMAYRITGMQGMIANNRESTKESIEEGRLMVSESGKLRPPAFIKNRWESLVSESLSFYYKIMRMYFSKIDDYFNKISSLNKQLTQKAKTYRK